MIASIETAFNAVGAFLLVAVGMYLVVRLTTAAFFKSKKDYEKDKTTGEE